MNCQEFESNVVSLARNQMADAGNRQQSLAHAETCLRCAERLAEAQTLIAGIRAVMVEISDSEAPPHVESALLTTFRAQARRKNASVVAFASAKKPASRWRSGLTYAACAATVVVILGGAIWFKRYSSSPNQPTISKQSKQQEPKVQVNVAEVKPPDRTDGRQPKPRTRARRTAPQEEDVANLFFSLVEEGELAPLESGRVVRVEMPASALISFGLQISAEVLTQPVQADLLLGQDGLARAVRFLSANQITKTQ